MGEPLLQTTPTAWIAHNNLGLIQLNRGETTEGHCRLSHSPALSSTSQHCLGESWAGLFPSLDRNHRRPSAFRKSVELEPEDADALNLAANLFCRWNAAMTKALPLYLAALARKDDPRNRDQLCKPCLIEAGPLARCCAKVADYCPKATLTFPPGNAITWPTSAKSWSTNDQALVQLRGPSEPGTRVRRNLIWLMRSLIRGEHYQEASPLAEALLNREPSPQVLALAARVAAENGCCGHRNSALGNGRVSVTSPAASTLQDYAWFFGDPPKQARATSAGRALGECSIGSEACQTQPHRRFWIASPQLTHQWRTSQVPSFLLREQLLPCRQWMPAVESFQSRLDLVSRGASPSIDNGILR